MLLACTLAHVAHTSPRAAHHRTRHAAPSLASACHTVRDTVYVPSAWEQEWLQRVNGVAHPCADMLQHADRTAVWLAGPASPDTFDATVFSHFEKTCVSETGKRTVVKEPIEPLVGHMRHPHGLKACVLAGQTPIDVQSRAYIALMGNSDDRLFDLYPGRKILVDAGTGTFDTSLAWFVSAYAARGIHFDAIYAWEANHVDAARYWASVPDELRPRLHFFNAPITPARASRMNPVTLIKEVADPGDFVAFKLDIDNDAVETAIMDQLEADDCAIERIAEMFYEKHYDSPDMREYFGAPPVTLAQATHNFAALRRKGLRLHYWP